MIVPRALHRLPPHPLLPPSSSCWTRLPAPARAPMASPHPSAVDRLRISATTGLPLASPRLRLHRGAEISFNSSRSPAVAPGARTDDSDDSAQRVPLTGLQARANASPRTPSGFGLSHAHPGPFPTHLAKSPQPEFVKGHRVLKISTSVRQDWAEADAQLVDSTHAQPPLCSVSSSCCAV